MPTYVYQCSSCDSTFEVEQRITENALDSCACGSTGTVKRIIQPIAVMFKGSGFHINDYAAPAAKTDIPSETKTETESKVETKVEAPAATPAPAAAVPASTES
jgi:putative FmdB family regulatory protein